MNSRTEGDDHPWVAVDAPPLLAKLAGDDNNEIRFTDADILEGITTGELIVTYAP